MEKKGYKYKEGEVLMQRQTRCFGVVVRISQPRLLYSNEYRMDIELSAQTRARKNRQPD